jgi:hypothetical protein
MAVNQDSTGSTERRRYKRYKVRDEAYAFLGEETGTLVDISQGGVAIHCAVFEKEPVFPSHLDLFTAQPHFYLPNIPIALVSEVQTVPPSIFSLLRIKRFSMQFGTLSDEQLARIDAFIANNTLADN